MTRLLALRDCQIKGDKGPERILQGQEFEVSDPAVALDLLELGDASLLTEIEVEAQVEVVPDEPSDPEPKKKRAKAETGT